MSSEKLAVSKIRWGTVIDHIPAGYALKVLSILGIQGNEGYRVAVIMNVESSKLGRKDIVKVEERELRPDEVNRIALIAPTATINIIRDYEVYKKLKVEIPEVIEEILKCGNPTCITNQPREPVKPRFKLVCRAPVKLQCVYCGRYIERGEIEKQLTR